MFFKLIYARAIALSAVAYGWFACLLPLCVSTPLWHVMKRCEQTAWMRNTWLRAIIQGGTTHLDIVSACSLFRIVTTLKERRLCGWIHGAGCPAHALRKWMKFHDWTESSQWTWKIDGLPGLNMSLDDLSYNLH